MSKQFRHKSFMQGLEQIRTNVRSGIIPSGNFSLLVFERQQERWAASIRKQIAEVGKPVLVNGQTRMMAAGITVKMPDVIPPVKERKLTGAVRKGLKRGKAA